ncbi:hypothetical protein HB818_13415 [Listeria booriae]|uniref:hypothetical protein n=1 Tax=Listeria booriae TaxID=1552123 RepID=UPI001626BA3D|nr:hypothetical protein [Listeria booriae]MBC1286758.1 hypothetical protein [Listeria booriae]
MIAEKVKDKSAAIIPIIRTKHSSKIIPSASKGINCANLSDGFESKGFEGLLGKIHGYDVKKTVQKIPKETIAKTLDVNLSKIKSSNEMNLIDLKIMNPVAEK